ncbi:hypothetical protein O0555_09020 [Brevibacillus laterosporus]|uniref:hypothetical protein n=1 Tax=Brevibacillus laterosporus TaxID=1465 RepID=UPI0018CE62EF|nr:hypothetical protein [Brevibacillus laterosporus]MBG9799476.1 hypothetical protein [Brevibacillus laterosporus]MCR8937493.1 hypothetical protein [Brevibacillus laterosporus]MCZ0840132.1 hypothetical protein [Brevibacillus laterosporus]MCZ0843928.1 hypothetical protein [Brevibacillus laterosporus]MED1909816.1 hypothetical protein [Brevibacillus laterosporus]
MKKKTLASLATLLVLSVTALSGLGLSGVSAKKNETPNEDVIYLNEQPVKTNEVIYATPENQEELVKKYGLEKPSETAKLRSIRVIDTPSEMEQNQENEHKNKTLALGGYRFEKEKAKNVDGSDEIARGKYFCNKKSGSCKAAIALSANEDVSVELNATFGASYNDMVSAEFGYSVGSTVGVSTTVNVQNESIPAKKTWIVVGYPVYKATFFKLYDDSIFGSKYIGSGTFMVPKRSSLAVTDWIQG